MKGIAAKKTRSEAIKQEVQPIVINKKYTDSKIMIPKIAYPHRAQFQPFKKPKPKPKNKAARTAKLKKMRQPRKFFVIGQRKAETTKRGKDITKSNEEGTIKSQAMTEIERGRFIKSLKKKHSFALKKAKIEAHFFKSLSIGIS